MNNLANINMIDTIFTYHRFATNIFVYEKDGHLY